MQDAAPSARDWYKVLSTAGRFHDSSDHSLLLYPFGALHPEALRQYRQPRWSSGGENSQDKYNQELIDRFKSMQRNDSCGQYPFCRLLKVQTKRMGRTVYGGGGIMPDFFVPIDTTQYTDYHRNLVAKGVVIKATTGYIEKHRKELQNKYKKFGGLQREILRETITSLPEIMCACRQRENQV